MKNFDFFAGFRRLSQAFAGFRRLSRAFAGFCGLLRAFAGFCGLSRAFAGFRGLSRAFFVTIFIFQVDTIYAQQFPFSDLVGTNIRREDPINRLGFAGFVREYHDWVIDEGDRYLPTTSGNASTNFPSNLYRWNPGYQGMTFERFPGFYTNIINNLNEVQTAFRPICADLKSCLPHLSGTGGLSNQDMAQNPILKPYWDIATEFKPVLTNRSGNTNGSQDLFVNANTTPATTSNLAILNPTNIPASYLWYADWVTHFSKAFAADGTGNLNNFKVVSGDGTNTGQDQVGYVEIWNEQDKNWFDSRFTGIPNMTRFTPEEYAAMGGMAFDGFSQGVFTQGQTSGGVTYPLGFNNVVNGNARYVFGGLFDIGAAQWNYVAEVNNVCNGVGPMGASSARRVGYISSPNAHDRFPFQVLNFHHYCDNSVTNLGNFGVAPELDNVAEAGGTPLTFKARLRTIRNNSITLFGADTKELWLSEFGWDTNLESDQRATQPGISQEEAQGRWMNRIYLEIAAAKWDRAMQFCVRDEVTQASGFGSRDAARYKSSGVVRDRANNYAAKLAFWYVSTMRNTLANHFFAQELECFDHTLANNTFPFTDDWQYNTPSGRPRIYLFKNAATNIANGTYPAISSVNQDILAVWSPTANNTTLPNYNIFFNNFDGNLSTPVTLVRSLPGDADGIRTALTMQFDATRQRFFVTIPLVTELPQYVILGNNTVDVNFPACPTNVGAIAVGCDAISLKWTNPQQVDGTSIYYFQASYGQAAPSFDLGNPQWRLYSDQYPAAAAGTSTQTVVAGLNQMAGTYYFAIVPRLNNRIPGTTCTFQINTAACFGGIPAATITAVNAGTANELFNYNDVTFCYPQRTAIAPLTGAWDAAGTTLTINLVSNGSANSFTLHAISLYDANGIDQITIQADNDFIDTNGFTTIGTYLTAKYLDWASLPLLTQGAWKRIRLIRSSVTQPEIRRIVLYGFPNTQTNYIEPGCCGSPTAIQVGSAAVPPKATASAAFGTITNQIGKEIVVNGSFNFDMASLTLDNCNVFMKENADVSLGSASNTTTKSLSIKGTTIQGCKTLWRGMKVFPVATSLFVEPNAAGKLSFIRDGEKAFNIQRNSSTSVLSLKFDRAIFEKNLFGIYINDNTCTGCSLLDINPSSIIKGNIFDGTSTEIKPPYAGMPAASYSAKSNAGMDMNKVASLSVGVTGADKNTFQNSFYGLMVRNSNLTVLNSNFKDITVTLGGTGMGIWGRDQAKIDQTGLGNTNSPNDPVTFNNVQYGLYMTNAGFKAKNNRMTNINGSGVECSTPIVATNDFNRIDNNNINTNNRGVYIFNNNVKARVLNNFVTNSFDKNIFGIQCTGISNTGVKAFDIRGNNVTLRSNPADLTTIGAGIFTSNTNLSNVEGNTLNILNYNLSLNAPAGQNNNNGFYPYIHGIYETNDKSGTFCSNTVTGVYQNAGWGIKTENSTGNKYDCNIIGTVGKGLTFLGNCTTTGATSPNNIVDNDFVGNYTHGLYLQANGANTAQIGKQFHTGNDWFVSNVANPDWGALYDNPTSADLLNNKIDVNFSDVELGHVSPATWFAPSTATDLTCQNPCSTNQINMVGHGQGVEQHATGNVQERGAELIFNNGMYWDVVLGKNQMENFSEAYQWMINRNIYRDISDVYGADVPAEYSTFMAEKEKTSVGQYQAFESMLGKIGLSNPDLIDEVLSLESEIETQLQKWQPELETFQALSADEQKKLLEGGNVKIPELGNLWYERSQAYAALNAANPKYIAQLLELNESLPAEKEFEQDEQQVNRIYLSLLQKGLPKEVDDNDAKTLERVADLCPFEGGFAVYKARNLYAWLFDTYKLNWFECEDEIKPRKVDNKIYIANERFDFDVIPNPTSDHFYINVLNAADGQFGFRLINLTGQVVLQKSVIDGIERFETAGFSNGIYLIEITNNKGEKAIKRVFINH